MTAPPAAPPPPPGLDLRLLRIEAAAGLLRDWAAETVAGLFAADAAVVGPAAVGPAAVGPAAVGPAAVGPGRLAELKLAAWRWRRRAARRLEKGITAPLRLRHESSSPGHPISLLLARHQRSERRWWLPRRLAAPVDPYWPPALWPAISTLAWREPRFQRDTAAAILDHFRRRVLMAGEAAIPVFRVEVWWLAVELVGVPALWRPPEEGAYLFLRRLAGDGLAKALWRSWHRRSGRGHLRDRLSAIARGEVFGARGWAGFWEQWLVGEITLRRPELVAEASAECRQLLSVLPLLSEAPYRAARNRVALPAPQSVVRELSVLIDPRWESQRPGAAPLSREAAPSWPR